MTMATNLAAEEVQTLNILKEVAIAAPIDTAFAALVEQLGPAGDMPGGRPMPMVLEAWPGGRWVRDLGNNAGHLWGHVQVIKPPALLELSGPLFMSFPAANHVQYRLTEEGGITRLKLTHRSFGLIPPDLAERAGEGWEHILTRIRHIAERLARS
jgi:uncharacterized protein YndB with AHSA1/START domain